MNSPDHSKKNSLTRDIAGVFGARATFALLGMLSGIILARWLGPHDRGILALVLLLPATAVTLVKLGISQSNVYFINRKRASPAQVASNAAVMALCFGGLSAMAVWLLREPLQSTALRAVPTWALAVAVVRVPFILLDNYLYGVLQAVGRFPVYNARLIFGETLRFVLVVLALVVFDWGLPGAVLLQTLVTFANVTWTVVATRRVVPFSLRLRRSLLWGQLSFGVKSWVQTLTAHLLLRIDIYMVAYFLDPRHTAFYALALRFTELVLEIPQAVGLVLYPKLATLPDEEIHKLTAQACRRTLLVTSIAALGLTTVGPRLIVLWYGQPYAPAGAPLPWAALAVVMMSLFTILSRNFTSRNRQQVNIIAGLLALALNVGLNIVLIPSRGIVGAAMATAVSYSVSCFLLLFAFLTVSRLSLLDVVLPTVGDFEFFWKTFRRIVSRVMPKWVRRSR